MIEVVKPGALSTLQDLGRFGYQRYGVIVGGVLDEWAHRVANILVGNDQAEATLEITLLGPTLRFRVPALIAICGADLSARIGEHDVPLETPIVVREHSELAFGRRRRGCRAYLAVGGGFDVPRVMGSKSTYLRAAFGGVQGRALAKGDVVAIGSSDGLARHRAALARESNKPFVEIGAAIAARDDVGDVVSIRVIEGQQWPMFSDDAKRRLLDSEFVVTPTSDRMGYRLEGAKLAPREPIEMISEGVSFGTIQVPPDGNPIVLMADCQTTGGYPKIAHVASVDLPRLAQMMPGHRIRFESISLEDAQRLHLEREADIARIAAAIARA